MDNTSVNDSWYQVVSEGLLVPDYQTAALVGSYIAISTKQDASIGITLAIPVAMLMVQLDVLKWSINIFFQNKAEKFAEAENYKGIERMHYCGVLCTMCTSGIPVLLTVILGQSLLVESSITSRTGCQVVCQSQVVCFRQ